MDTPTLEFNLQSRQVGRFLSITCRHADEVVYTCNSILYLYRRHNSVAFILIQFNSHDVLSIIMTPRVAHRRETVMDTPEHLHYFRSSGSNM